MSARSSNGVGVKPIRRKGTGTITRAVRTGIATDTAYGSVVPPIYLSANYAFASPGVPGRYDYSRTANPTRDQLADAIAGLEHGTGAVINDGHSVLLNQRLTVVIRFWLPNRAPC